MLPKASWKSKVLNRTFKVDCGFSQWDTELVIFGLRDHRSKGAWSCRASTRKYYANGPRRSPTTETAQPDEKCRVVKALKVILESSLPPVIKGKLSTGDVGRTEFQSDGCSCSVEIRNRRSLKSGREEEVLGDGSVGLAEDDEGCTLVEVRIKKEEAAWGEMSEDEPLRRQWLVSVEEEEAVREGGS